MFVNFVCTFCSLCEPYLHLRNLRNLWIKGFTAHYNYTMDSNTIQRLLALNHQFYQTFAAPFSATRQRLQPGVLRLLPAILSAERILDLGCGNGELARQLHQRGYQGAYLGLDFSAGLLAVSSRDLPPEHFRFLQADLASPPWLPPAEPPFDLALAFAVLHHLPGAALRQQVVTEIHRLLLPAGHFIHSNWQFLNSPRLARRIQSWSAVGIPDSALEPGDYLLDWRQGGQGLRYVHHFSEEELGELAQQSEFTVLENFLSDGEGGRLGLYQVWEG
jgi:tRNA (uracil-5-)-methyltransferase TRM9